MAWLSLRLSGIRSLAVAWPLHSSSGLSWLCAEVTTSACSISAKLLLFSKPITDKQIFDAHFEKFGSLQITHKNIELKLKKEYFQSQK
jgi:hypothetical protein